MAEALRETWEAIPIQNLYTLVTSMDNRLDLLVAANGGLIRY
jgi:hypothetical protein